MTEAPSSNRERADRAPLLVRLHEAVHGDSRVSHEHHGRDESRASGSERGSPHNWCAETRRAHADFLRVVYEQRLRPRHEGFVGATWDDIARLCPQVRDGLAAGAKYRRFKNLYRTPAALPAALYEVFSTYLQETDPNEVVALENSNRRALSLNPAVDTEMMQIVRDARLWMIHLDDREEQDDTLEETVARRMPRRSPVMIRAKMQQLVEAIKDPDHAHHNTLVRHPKLKRLMEEYVRVDEKALKSMLKWFAQQHPAEVEGANASFVDVLLWGLKHVLLQSVSGRFSKVLFTKLVQFVNDALPASAPVFHVDNCMDWNRELFQLWKRDDKADFLTPSQIRSMQWISDQKRRLREHPPLAAKESKRAEVRQRNHDEADAAQVEQPKRVRLSSADSSHAQGVPASCLHPPATPTAKVDDAVIARAILGEIARRSYRERGSPDWKAIGMHITNLLQIGLLLSAADCLEVWLVYRQLPSFALFDGISREDRKRLSSLDDSGEALQEPEFMDTHEDVEFPYEPEQQGDDVGEMPTTYSSPSLGNADTAVGDDDMSSDHVSVSHEPRIARDTCDELDAGSKSDDAPLVDDAGGHDVDMEEVMDSAAIAHGDPCRSHVIPSQRNRTWK